MDPSRVFGFAFIGLFAGSILGYVMSNEVAPRTLGLSSPWQGLPAVPSSIAIAGELVSRDVEERKIVIDAVSPYAETERLRLKLSVQNADAPVLRMQSGVQARFVVERASGVLQVIDVRTLATTYGK